MSQLPLLQVSRPDSEKWSDSGIYYRSLFATYSNCCGVSAQHLSAKAHPIIVSVMRFHLYLIRRMEDVESMAAISREYGAGALYGKVEKTPRSDVWVTQTHKLKVQTGKFLTTGK